MRSSVFIGCPSLYGVLDCGCAEGLYKHASRSMETIEKVQVGLATATACTRLWATALNLRDGHGVGWFALLHSDVDPEVWWVDRLIGLAEEHDADMVSTVIPLKGERGLTSTALAHPENPGLFCARLTLRQLHHRSFPRTFDAVGAVESLAKLPDEMSVVCPEGCHLLANTGCMVVRLDRPWVGDVWFDTIDRIHQADGQWQTASFPEDWSFALRVTKAGGRVFATTEVRAIHKGGGSFANDVADRGLPRDDGMFN